MKCYKISTNRKGKWELCYTSEECFKIKIKLNNEVKYSFSQMREEGVDDFKKRFREDLVPHLVENGVLPSSFDSPEAQVGLEL